MNRRERSIRFFEFECFWHPVESCPTVSFLPVSDSVINIRVEDTHGEQYQE
jgi:hypothetical protein